MLPGAAPAVLLQTLPLIAAFMPLDAAASVMDGVLLGSQEAGWISKTMAFTAAACATGLLLSQRMGWPLLTIWFVIKVRAGGPARGRAGGGAWQALALSRVLARVCRSTRSATLAKLPPCCCTEVEWQQPGCQPEQHRPAIPGSHPAATRPWACCSS